MSKLDETVAEIGVMKRDGTLPTALLVVGSFAWAASQKWGAPGALLGALAGVGLTMVPFGGSK